MLFIESVPNTIRSTITAAISTDPLIDSKILELTLVHQSKTIKLSNEITKARLSNKAEDEDYIITCQNGYIDDIEVNINDLEIKQSAFYDYLEKSSIAEHKLAYILFATHAHQTSQLELLQSYLKEYPNNILARMNLIGHCSSNIEHSACNQELFEQAGEIDGNNAGLWLQVANFYAAKGNKQETIKAINMANKANQFNDYYYQHLSLFMDVSKGTLDISDSLKAITGIGILAATQIPIMAVTNFCTAIDTLTADEKQACLMLGEQMDIKGRNLLYNSVGIAIQSKIYQAEANEELSALVEARNSDLYNPKKSRLHNKAGELMIADETLFQYWLSNAVNYGEVKAANMLIEEAILLSKNKHYNPCSIE